MDFKNKVVLVTGSSQGVGRELAVGFAKAGAKVAINYNKSQAAAQETEKLVRAHGAEAVVIQADVSKEEDVARMVAETVKAFGGLDILVNNAGIFEDAVSWKMTREAWNKVLDTDLTGVFLCTKHALPHMRQKGWGRIVNVSSVVGQAGVFGASNYAAAKAGISGFSKSIAREVANKQITVNTVSLGYIEIGMMKRLPESSYDAILKSIPMGRWGKPEEVVQTVLFLASEGAGYITGQSIAINGGFYM